jgi:hypothetical protein
VAPADRRLTGHVTVCTFQSQTKSVASRAAIDTIFKKKICQGLTCMLVSTVRISARVALDDRLHIAQTPEDPIGPGLPRMLQLKIFSRRFVIVRSILRTHLQHAGRTGYLRIGF